MKNFLSLLALVSPVLLTAQNADSVSYYVQKGNEAKQGKLFMVASQQYKKAIQFDATNAEAQRELGNVYVEMRKYQEAILAYSEVIKKEPNDPVANENLANLYFMTHRWNDAVTAAKKMQQLKIGKNADYILGKSFSELEDYGQSYSYLQAAAKQDSLNADIPYTIARGFVEMSNYRNAAPFFLRAIALDTSKPRWVYETAMNFAAIPDDKTAIKYYELAADRGYKIDNDYLENMSLSYEGAKQLDKAIELLKKVLEKKPADLALLNSIGELYYKTGKYQDAIDSWDKILGYDKQNAKALYMIGLAYQKKGDKDKGMQLCDKAIAMDPSLANLKQKKGNMGL
ncbi:MAG: tetratricopeptide repeat protein [Chitinophagaceae bacterium]